MSTDDINLASILLRDLSRTSAGGRGQPRPHSLAGGQARALAGSPNQGRRWGRPSKEVTLMDVVWRGSAKPFYYLNI